MPNKSDEVEPSEVSKDRDRAENWYKAYGGKFSRGFVQKFGRTLTKNELVVYMALSSYHNPAPQKGSVFEIIKTGCAWPRIRELQEACSLDRASTYQALRALSWDHGLVERWALYLKRGRRRRIKFFRMLHVSSGNLHLKEKQQLDMGELSDIPDEELPPEYAWRSKAQPLRARHYAREGEVYMYAQDQNGNEELVPRGKRKGKRKRNLKAKKPKKLAESAIHPKLRGAIPQVFQELD